MSLVDQTCCAYYPFSQISLIDLKQNIFFFYLSLDQGANIRSVIGTVFFYFKEINRDLYIVERKLCLWYSIANHHQPANQITY